MWSLFPIMGCLQLVPIKKKTSAINTPAALCISDIMLNSVMRFYRQNHLLCSLTILLQRDFWRLFSVIEFKHSWLYLENLYLVLDYPSVEVVLNFGVKYSKVSRWSTVIARVASVSTLAFAWLFRSVSSGVRLNLDHRYMVTYVLDTFKNGIPKVTMVNWDWLVSWLEWLDDIAHSLTTAWQSVEVVGWLQIRTAIYVAKTSAPKLVWSCVGRRHRWV